MVDLEAYAGEHLPLASRDPSLVRDVLVMGEAAARTMASWGMDE